MASDQVLLMDKKQSDPDTRQLCPKDPSHGALGVHVSGMYLVCTFHIAPRTVCGAQMPVSVE